MTELSIFWGAVDFGPGQWGLDAEHEVVTKAVRECVCAVCTNAHSIHTSIDTDTRVYTYMNY